jgi:hypothetical protein
MVTEKEKIGMGIAFLVMCLSKGIYENEEERQSMIKRENELRIKYKELENKNG